MPAPLTGIKVVDFTRYQNGPHATLMLADLGAEVIKVEMPGNGDPGRSLGRQPDGFCAYFEGLNRSKKSITLNLLKPESRDIVRRLVESADVLTENFRPGFLDSIGFGYDVVREWNPKIIFATNSGFGPRGEWRERGSFDVVAHGMSGAMISNGGGPGNEPVSLPWGLADQVEHVLRLWHRGAVARSSTSRRKIDVSQLGAMLSLQSFSLVGFLQSS
jgi:CoA:oxalate CoA-transferase